MKISKQVIDKLERRNPYMSEGGSASHRKRQCWLRRGYRHAIAEMMKLNEEVTTEQTNDDKGFLKQAFGLKTRELNQYCIRINHDESPDVYFDWYHTTGTILMHTNEEQVNVGKLKDAEDVANLIKNQIYIQIGLTI